MSAIFRKEQIQQSITTR